MYSRLERLRNRRVDPQVKSIGLLHEAWDHIQNSEPVAFALGAMQPIDPDYTKKSFAEADRVANQLQKGLTQVVEFEYQGSTTNDTHIKAASDIDLLTLLAPHVFFAFVEFPLTVAKGSEYTGNPRSDLTGLKNDSVALLRLRFPEAKVVPGGKSIAVEGGSLSRKVDVVPSAWSNNKEWLQTRDKRYRGVELLNSESGQLILNKPFLHNARLDEKDAVCGGNMRKAIRLLKSLKYDSTSSVDLSSYHICGIIYNMPNNMLQMPKGYDLLLLDRSRSWCEQLRDDQRLRDSLKMPNGTEYVFGNSGARLAGLNQMIAELIGLQHDIINDNKKSFQRLAEVRYELPTPPPAFKHPGYSSSMFGAR